MSLPQKMRALQVVELGENYKGVRLNEIAVPQPGEGEILLKIRAGSLGFPDLLMTQGGYQHKPDLPFIPGGDVSGEIAALGDGVSGFAVGDRVVTSRLGGSCVSRVSLSDSLCVAGTASQYPAGRMAAGAWGSRRRGPRGGRSRQAPWCESDRGGFAG